MGPTTTPTTQTTQDYDQFTILGANRDLSRGHVEAIKRAFEEYGNFTAAQPILVNDNYEIIDGQHRFIACKELGEPVNFTVVPGLGVAEARNMNALHRSWTTEDYAKSYAQSGDRNYQKYLQLKDEYGFSNGIMMGAITGINAKGLFKAFRNGEFVVADEAAARKRLDNLAGISEVTPMAYDRNFAFALLKVMQSPDYDQARMVKKLAMAAPHLDKFVQIEDNLRQIEGAYNWKQQGERVRLF